MRTPLQDHRERRRQMTAAARRAQAARSPEAKRAHYEKMVRASNARRLVLPGDQADALRRIVALHDEITTLLASITKLQITGTSEESGS